jgi:hypothetical protein
VSDRVSGNVIVNLKENFNVIVAQVEMKIISTLPSWPIGAQNNPGGDENENHSYLAHS